MPTSEKLYSYDPAEVAVIFAGKIIEGYADGTFVNISRAEDSFVLKVGADGQATRAKTNNRSGEVVLTLAQGSPSNDFLSAAILADEESGAGAGPLLVRDGSGRTVVSAATAWVRKPADASFGKEPTDRTWSFQTNALRPFVGGNTEI